MKKFMTRSSGNIEFTSFCRPLSDIVKITLDRHESSASCYYSQLAIGQFLQYFENELHHQNVCIPPEWTPFVTRSNRPSTEVIWDFKPPAGILMFLTPSILGGFNANQNGKGMELSEITAKAKARTVKNLLLAAHAEGVLNISQTLALEILPAEPDEDYEGRRLTDFEVTMLRQGLRQAAGSDDIGVRLRALRDLAAIDFVLFMGLKVEEVVRLTLSSFYQEKGRWWVNIRNKEGHNRKIKVHDIPYKNLTTWLTVSEIGVLGDASHQRIFMNLSRQGDTVGSSSMPTKTLRDTISKRCIDVGIETEEACDLRGTCAYNAYSRGASLFLVKEMLGHYDLVTTERYVRYLTHMKENSITAVDYVMY